SSCRAHTLRCARQSTQTAGRRTEDSRGTIASAMGAPMRRTILVLCALASALSLLSALAVLLSWLLDPAYRLYYGDSLLFVVGYAALQAWMTWSFVRDTPAVPWIALARAVAGLIFLALFVSVGPQWMRASPARYVYQLFDWGPQARAGLFALVFLGRGAFNTF